MTAVFNLVSRKDASEAVGGGNGTLDGIPAAQTMFAGYPDLMTTAHVAEAFNMTVQQVNNLCRAGKLPHVQVSERKRVVPKSALVEWIKEHTVSV